MWVNKPFLIWLTHDFALYIGSKKLFMGISGCTFSLSLLHLKCPHHGHLMCHSHYWINTQFWVQHNNDYILYKNDSFLFSQQSTPTLEDVFCYPNQACKLWSNLCERSCFQLIFEMDKIHWLVPSQKLGFTCQWTYLLQQQPEF